MIDVCPGYNYQSISVSSLSNDLSHPTHTGPPADTVINCSLSVDSRHAPSLQRVERLVAHCSRDDAEEPVKASYLKLYELT